MSTGVIWQQPWEAQHRAQLAANEEACCDRFSTGTRPGAGRGESERALVILQASALRPSPGGAAGSSKKSWSWRGPHHAIGTLEILGRTGALHTCPQVYKVGPASVPRGSSRPQLWDSGPSSTSGQAGRRSPLRCLTVCCWGESQEGMAAQQLHPPSQGLQAVGLGLPGRLVYHLGRVGTRLVRAKRQSQSSSLVEGASLRGLANLPSGAHGSRFVTLACRVRALWSQSQH